MRVSNTVIIKGNKHGITVVLNGDDSFADLKNSVREKFRQSAAFFGKADMALAFEGRFLSEDQQIQLMEIIQEETEMNILCIVDLDKDRDALFEAAVKTQTELQEEMPGTTTAHNNNAVCSFSVGVDETVIKAVSLLDDIGIALIGYIGFTVSALAILTGAISSKVVNIIKTRNKMVVLERILLSFYLMGIVCAAVVLVALILHFIVEIPVASIFIINLIGISILSYFIIFILFYSVKLIGNCLELFYIVNGYELLDEEKTDYKAIYNNYRITAIEKVNLSNTSIEKVNEYKEVVKQLIETDNRSEEEIKVLLEMHKSQFGD